MMKGNGGVGKSNLFIKFTRDYFVDEYDPTIEDAYRRQYVVDDEICLYDILDPSGSEESNVYHHRIMQQQQGFIVVYSITSQSSFEEVPRTVFEILRIKDAEKVTIIIVGNKFDLDDQREVPTEEGQELARSLRCPFFEASAKTRHNVVEVFHQIVREIRKEDPRRKELTNQASTPKKKQKECAIM